MDCGKATGLSPTGEIYEPILNGRSEPLKLKLQVEAELIGFYREDTGEKLLIPGELAEALHQATQARQQAEAEAEQAQQQAEQAQQQAERLVEQLRSFGVEPDLN